MKSHNIPGGFSNYRNTFFDTFQADRPLNDAFATAANAPEVTVGPGITFGLTIYGDQHLYAHDYMGDGSNIGP